MQAVFRTSKETYAYKTPDLDSEKLISLEVHNIFEIHRIIIRKEKEWIKTKLKSGQDCFVPIDEKIATSKKVKLHDTKLIGFSFKIKDENQFSIKSYLNRVHDKNEKIPTGKKRFTLKCVPSNLENRTVTESYDYNPDLVEISTFVISEKEKFCLFEHTSSPIPGFQEVYTQNEKYGFVLTCLETMTFEDKTYKFFVSLFSILFSVVIFFWFYNRGFIAYGKIFYLIGIAIAVILAVFTTKLLVSIGVIGKSLGKRL